jgi:hypothetical protein
MYTNFPNTNTFLLIPECLNYSLTQSEQVSEADINTIRVSQSLQYATNA